MPMDRKRFNRMLGEGAVIVISILLAFWIDAWWGAKQDSVREKAILESINSESLENQVELDRAIQRFAESTLAVDAFFNMTPQELGALPPDSAEMILGDMFGTYTYDPQNASSQALLSISQSLSDEGLNIRQKVSTLQRLVDDSSEEADAHWEWTLKALHVLALSSVESVPGGAAFVSTMASRLGPQVMSELRTNDDFIAAIMVKHSTGFAYQSELAGISGALDELRSALSELDPD